MAELDPKALAAINAAIDAWIDDHRVMFGSESERRKALFGALSRQSKAWNRPHTCMYRGCSNPSIIRSHTLQRSKVLDTLAEDGHVIGPGVDNEGCIIMERIGVGKASTFPGFCSEHENLFSEFENIGNIQNSRHVALQSYRTICREISRRRHILNHVTIELESYREYRNQYFRNSIESIDAEISFQCAKIDGDEREQIAVDAIKQLSETLSHLDGLYNAVSDFLESRKSAIYGRAVSVEIKIPVALSGIVLVSYRKRSEKTRIAPMAFGVVPQAASTVVFLTTLGNHRALLDRWAHQLEKGLLAIELIEGWMTHGSDHWFIPPSLWDALGGERQERILNDIQSTDGVPTLDPAEPIFDELRRQFVTALRQEIAETENSRPEILELLYKEEGKLPSLISHSPKL